MLARNSNSWRLDFFAFFWILEEQRYSIHKPIIMSMFKPISVVKETKLKFTEHHAHMKLYESDGETVRESVIHITQFTICKNRSGSE